jgi:hypothetical protein
MCSHRKKHSFYVYAGILLMQSLYLWSCGKKSDSTSTTNAEGGISGGSSSNSSSLPFALPSNLGTATYNNDDPNYTFLPKAAFFDAALGNGGATLELRIILTDDTSVCALNANAPATKSWNLSKNSKFMVFKLIHLSTTESSSTIKEKVNLTTGKYTIDSTKLFNYEHSIGNTQDIAGLLGDAYFVALNNQCVMQPSFTINSGFIELTEISLTDITNIGSLTVKANYEFQINNELKSNVKGEIHAYACSALSGAFFHASNNQSNHSISTKIECK